MAFRYANQSDVLSQLGASPDDTALVSQLERIEHALADAFDAKVARSWGSVATPTTRTFRDQSCSCVLALQSPARSIVSVRAGGTWDGTTWVGDDAVTDWYEMFSREGLIYGIGLDRHWPRSVRVMAVWAHDSEETVPGDVSHCLTWLTIRQYRRETASPMELVGPDGLTVPTPHAWDDPMVKTVIEKYRVVEVIV